MPMPMVDFCGMRISRLLCGSNPFLGFSYRSEGHDAWQRGHFTVDRVADVIQSCLEHGINTLLGNYEPARLLPQALDEVERRCGTRPLWIAYVAGADDALADQVLSVVNDGATACYVQCGMIDDSFSFLRGDRPVFDGSDTMDRLLDTVETIRSHGLPAGLGSHFWQILFEMQRRAYDVDFMVTTLNTVGVHNRGYAETVQAIRTIPKPFIAIKTLGGSAKVRPVDGLTSAFTALKPGDVVGVGMEYAEAVRENVTIVTTLQSYL